MLCYVMLCYVMLCYVMLCYVMLCYVVFCCFVVLCCVVLCFVVLLCCAVLCYIILYYVMLYYIILCYVVIVYYIILYYNHTGPPSYMRPVVDLDVVTRRIPVSPSETLATIYQTTRCHNTENHNNNLYRREVFNPDLVQSSRLLHSCDLKSFSPSKFMCFPCHHVQAIASAYHRRPYFIQLLINDLFKAFAGRQRWVRMGQCIVDRKLGQKTDPRFLMYVGAGWKPPPQSSSSCSWRIRRVSCSLILKIKLVPPPLL
jgi:hypothetical protein